MLGYWYSYKIFIKGDKSAEETHSESTYTQ